ncbi:hypothetical protein FF80_01806 [Devosia sp. LC5]|uniref:hypothetical protein n=1 Tax=Devosia sp. LC5 TaxID=1502724 RepID=UPI0004E2A6DB|nr:hypothetical protein [Devosia sp. LC5]KFC68851.1 hypothetical protein FF80_01806 [Devosia sp. LC5]
MAAKLLSRLAAMVGLGLILTGCIDAKVDIALTSPTTARASLTQVMAADFYAMLKMNSGPAGSKDDDRFCTSGKLTENQDGSATCLVDQEGRFASLDLGEVEAPVHFRSAGRGLVRISVSTRQMKTEVDMGEELDAETRQMLEAFFAKRTITLRFSGLSVTQTNMKRSPDGSSAEMVIPILDLIDGTAVLPDEIYAVVRAP